MMDQKMMTERLREIVSEEQEKTGCEIRLCLERRLSGPAGTIAYHNSRIRTVTLNLQKIPAFSRRNSGLPRDIMMDSTATSVARSQYTVSIFAYSNGWKNTR